MLRGLRQWGGWLVAAPAASASGALKGPLGLGAGWAAAGLSIPAGQHMEQARAQRCLQGGNRQTSMRGAARKAIAMEEEPPTLSAVTAEALNPS